MKEDGTIKIGDIVAPAPVVLAALFNRAQSQGMGLLQHQPGHTMTTEEAADTLIRSQYFDYLEGRVMKVDFSGDEIETWLYDRDNGQGAAVAAVKEAVGQPESDQPPSEKDGPVDTKKDADRIRERFGEVLTEPGIVPPGCTLDKTLVFILSREGKDPCEGCNMDRSVCGGRFDPHD